MKKAKKFLSVLIAIVLTLSITIPAIAAETTTAIPQTYSITIQNTAPGHTYEAYQIFSGDLHGKVLSNVEWANGQTTHNVGDDATEAAAALKTEADAEALAKSLTLGTAAGSTSEQVDNKYVISNLAPGYYIIKDKDNSLTDNKNDAYTDFIVKVVADTTATPKSALPTIDKLVQDEESDPDTTSTGGGWGETADHDIFESFKYKITAAIPADNNLDSYSSYKVIFHDTMSDGITFESIESVKVTAANGTVTDIVKKDAANPNGYECNATPNQPGDQFQLTIADLLKVIDNIKGASVEVIYNAHLNENAQLGAEGQNLNTALLEYSNNPNNAANTGKTTEDTVWVFTFTMDNTKVDGATKSPLAGAGFRLYKEVTKINEETGEPVINQETGKPETIEVEIPLIYDTAKSAYRPVKEGETGEEMFSAENTGKFDIIGVDAGEYILKETTTPGGYNKCKDAKIKIEAVHSDNPMDPNKANCTVTKSINGVFANNFVIENNKGSVLPETGGMGTVIFYVVGGVLVAGAVIVLITRKRMAAEK